MSIPTPPSTTLSTPSPTEQNMSLTSQFRKPIYLIVATSLSPPMGIGLRGGLPWSSIRTDMAFFRKVTSNSSPNQLNAVIMGRKTWDSIPRKFRPLAGRVNVVITRSDTRRVGRGILDELNSSTGSGFEMQDVNGGTLVVSENGVGEGETSKSSMSPPVLVANSLQRCLEALDSESTPLTGLVDKVFCIGGAELYRQCVEDEVLRSNVRIVQTQVKRVDGKEIECDTFFPVRLIEDGDGEWERKQAETVKDWLALELPQGNGMEWVVDEKAGVQLRVIGWERK